ncbi:MAG: CTP synthase [Candidatus Magasanikbacteria bacterium RIFCSPHIGHO2_01_FULL_41_23]|uniref:CTP synthase n=1 Tax=Candidatus Magasanikbacteria bacterium RIFCSPLOWO2_01_FULL_40_15 TaxID=1798686 RepID=A0A1F6N0E2_9BACT|nr:MAG: CTP synthase [Candidatus Magasanikbacteria bacterium RIFCSPHIGHO2_01_FULL_41_23]OGH74641.1 MAG: CTP synthase [Candidatus Magasanikbacteria bacterium RIFCSPHIGHO2_12_FULL_41_16]OGH77354.1 MAG: CTP synthase [Candidatus Magasanikbacteria bacterium RIFCSPLOWO2_01_FULL_40_15]
MSKSHHPKFIFVVGGVLSGVGKGVTTASLGAIFKAKGMRVTALKIDPYVNVDAGTMNPIEHGEVFVTDDRDETDQDMGNYERFLDVDLDSNSYMTTGRVYLTVIENERAMKYKGKCVQVVPDVPKEVIRRIATAAKNHRAEITIIEVGGTVGEYENILFLEAARMMKLANPADVAFVLVSYLPIPSHLGEMKTKPTQHAARALNSVGINSDVIIARGEYALDKPRLEKLAVFCGVKPEHCISAPDVPSIYQIPLTLEEQNLGNKLLKILNLKTRPSNLKPWQDFLKRIQSSTREVKIAVVGKYFGTGDYTLADSYHSVIESIKHAAWFNDRKPILDWIDSEEFERDENSIKKLSRYDGVIVPGGFGTRGIEGIIRAIQYAREHKIPFLGLCYGMQLATIEFARNVLGKKDANTVEVNPQTTDPIIFINPVQAKNVRTNKYGGTMRLGAYDCALRQGTKTQKAYEMDLISERHRHRYEFNNAYRAEMDAAGLQVVGINPETDLVEIVELSDHPFFVGTQFHPEFKSRPMRPHPLFREFIKAAKK